MSGGDRAFGFPVGNVGNLRLRVGPEVPKPPGPLPFRYCPEGQAWRKTYTETAEALADERGAWGFLVVYPDGKAKISVCSAADSDPSAMHLVLVDEVQP